MFSYSKIPIRTRIAALLIADLAILPYAYIQYLNGKPDYLGISVRAGIILFFFWLAWPEVARLPKWIFIALPPAALLAVWRPQLLLYAIPIYFLLRILNFVVFDIFGPLPEEKSKAQKKCDVGNSKKNCK